MLSIRPWGNERIALLVEMALLSVLFMFMWGKKTRRSVYDKKIWVYKDSRTIFVDTDSRGVVLQEAAPEITANFAWCVDASSVPFISILFSIKICLGF